MTVGLSSTIRTNMMTQVLNAIDLGSGPGLLRFYDGTRPATGGTVTVKLAELTMSDPSGSVSNGVLTLSAITKDSSADATGTATWARIVDSALTFVMDLSVGTSGTDIIVATTAFVAGAEISITNFGSFSAGNP